VRALPAIDAVFASAPELSTASEMPSHARIEQWLAGAIGNGDIVAGDRLPPESDFAARLGVSRMTLRQSLAALEGRGLLQRKRGRAGGTFVSRPRIECDLTGLPGFTEQMRRAHVRAGARVVRAGVVEAPPAVAEGLDLPRGAAVFEIVRVRLAEGEPLALEETYLAVSDFPGLLDHELTGSLYSLMGRAYDHAPHTAWEWLEPVIATEEQARRLETEKGAAMMLVTRTAYTEAGKPIEHAFDRYRADRTRITLQTGIAHQKKSLDL